MTDNIRQAVEKDYGNTLGLVVYKSGEIVLEEYFSGANRNESVHTFSMVKSIVAVLVGIAIDKGFLKGVDQKIIDFFPDYKLKRNQEQLKEVTIEHFLTMTAPYKYKSEPWTKVCTSQDWGGKVLEMIGGKAQAGERFHYSTLGIQVLSNVLTIATGQSLKEFAENYLFEPLGIADVPNANVVDRASQEAFYKARNNRGWVKDPSGFYTTGWGLSLTTDEFARIGVMVINNGMYNGQRILSKEYIKQMLTEREDGYGYLWWIYPKNKPIRIRRKTHNAVKYDSFCANGVGGSLMTIIPEIDTVICMTCSFVYNPKARMELINEYLIPYIERL